MLSFENLLNKNEILASTNIKENQKKIPEILSSEEEIVLSEENNTTSSDLPLSSTIKLRFSLARDDLATIKNLYISADLVNFASDLVDELDKLAKHYGFKLNTVSGGYFWLEDNMWFSSDGRQAFQPQKALTGGHKYFEFVNSIDNTDLPGKEEEGYHSLNNPMPIQGISQHSLNLADKLTSQYSVSMTKTLSIIDGGNMLTGSRADGARYVLLGRDAVLQTTLKLSALDRERIAIRIEKIKQHNEEMRRQYHIAYYNVYEIDILLLEVAGLITADMDDEARQNLAQFTRVKAQLASELNMLAEIDSRPMNLSPAQRTALEKHYRTLYGTLPENFDNLLQKNYNTLVTAHELPSIYSDYLIKKKLEVWQPDPGAIARMSVMLQAGGFIRHSLDAEEAEAQAARFLTLIEISKDIMATELNVEPDNLVVVSQADFHIDMFLRPLSDGCVLLNDYAESIKLIANVLNDEDNYLTAKDRKDLQQTLSDLTQLYEERQSTTALITRQLENAGLTVIAVPGIFITGGRRVNYMNGVMGISTSQSDNSNQKFYITNASSIPALNHAFAACLKEKQPDLNVHFVGGSPSPVSSGLNQAESLLDRFGALDCITLHHGQNDQDEQNNTDSQDGQKDSDNILSLSEAMSNMPEQRSQSVAHRSVTEATLYNMSIPIHDVRYHE